MEFGGSKNVILINLRSEHVLKHGTWPLSIHLQGLQPLHSNSYPKIIGIAELADVSAEILASGKETWQDLVVTPLLASKEAVIAWLDKVTKASDASQKATQQDQEDQGKWLKSIDNKNFTRCCQGPYNELVYTTDTKLRLGKDYSFALDTIFWVKIVNFLKSEKFSKYFLFKNWK